MKKALLLSLGVVALSSCGYDSVEECYVVQEAKGVSSWTAGTYCRSLDYDKLSTKILPQR